MKYCISLLLLMTMSVAKGQIVNIPDANFKALLIAAGIDTNGDREIQEAEAATVPFVSIDTTVQDITGIRSFINLEGIGLSFSKVKFVDLQGMSKLKNIDFQYCDSLTSIIAKGCDNLESITSWRTGVKLLDIRDCKKIKIFQFEYSQLNTLLTTPNLDSLSNVSLRGNQFTKFDFPNLNNIKVLDIADSRLIDTLNLNGFSQLNNLGYSDAAISLKYANLSGCSKLPSIDLYSPQLSFLNLSGCKSLYQFNLTSAALEELDLSSCVALNYLQLIDCNGLQKLNLKNGSQLTSFNINCINLINVCADYFEIQSLRNYFQTYPIVPLPNVYEYCSFFPGGHFNTIKGTIKIDQNNNGCDSNDSGIAQLPIKINDGAGNIEFRYSTNSGDYAYYCTKGNYLVRPYFSYPYFLLNPISDNTIFDTTNNLEKISNFCIQPNGIHNDLEITFLPTWPPAKPGFDAGYTIVYKNRGTTTLNGNVQLNFDNSKMNFVSASENATTQSTGQLTWNYNNLQPFESRIIYVTFNLLPPPVNNIDDTLTFLATITPSVNDETPFDNSFILPQRVRGAMDPNEKQCLEGNKLDISKIGDYLHYQIHFQNEGNDTAFNVVVTDTLADNLDWNTLELISSSHPVDVRLNKNKAEFIFENIKLPYKAINEPGSNGYVAFKIKPKPSVVIGDSLNNKASIYFDFNLPIVTNTATTIVSSASSPVPVKLEYFSINTKNNTNTLNWKASCTYGNATFVIERSADGIHFNSIGNITATAMRCQLPLSFADKNPVAGKNYYRLKISDADGVSFYSKTLVVGNSKAGLDITAIANNIIYFSSNKQQSIQIKVIAADGKLIYAENKSIAAGTNQLNLSTKNAAPGVYTLLLYTSEGELINKRFLK